MMTLTAKIELDEFLAKATDDELSKFCRRLLPRILDRTAHAEEKYRRARAELSRRGFR